MSLLVHAAIAGSALIFIAVSAAMNAVFLSSLGQTTMETSLLAAVSLSADMAKAVLPVLVVRALFLRAWWHLALSSGMLGLLVALSLTSGTGFAALTRNAATANRVAHTDRIEGLRDRIR